LRTVLQNLTVTAPAIECDGCANSIKRSLGRLAGVSAAAVDITSKQVTVTYDPSATSEEAIRARLEAAGFPAS
jgi:copper chaperone CopZ